VVVRRGNLAWANNRKTLLDTQAGTPAVTRVSSPDGSFWRRCIPAAGVVQSTYMQEPQWPVGSDRTIEPASARLPLRWRFQLEVKRTGALVANAPACVGLQGDVPNDPAALNTNPCYLLHSIDSENAGRWTVYLRTRVAGALVKVDTGVDPTSGPHLVELLYDDTTAPLISLAIDGVVVDTRAGLANIPQYTSPNTTNWSVGAWNGFSVGGGAAQNDFWRNARLIISELPGYPS